jgi:kynurenine formamidase
MPASPVPPRWKQRPPGSNWGDFGADDEIGRMNLVTPQRRRAAVAEVREGLVFTLSLPLDYPGGMVLSANRKPPQRQAGRLAAGGDNYLFPYSRFAAQFQDVCCDDAVLLHTQYSTQWDALAHMGYAFDADGDGKPEVVFYNGFRAGEHVLGPAQEGGPNALALGVEKMACAGVQGRGVLVDLHAAYGREPTRVGYDALMRLIDEQKVDVQVGDFLCLHTGFGDVLLEQKRRPERHAVHKVCAGLDGRDAKLLQWITDSGIAAICADNVAVEIASAKPRGEEPQAMLPLHEHCLFKLGIHLGELWYFGELAKWLVANRRSAFLLTAPPLRMPGCVGSPVTPLATV